MTSSNPPSREGPNQFGPSLRRAPGRRDRRGGEFVGGYVGRLTTFTLSFEWKASPFFAKCSPNLRIPAILSATESRAYSIGKCPALANDRRGVPGSFLELALANQ